MDNTIINQIQSDTTKNTISSSSTSISNLNSTFNANQNQNQNNKLLYSTGTLTGVDISKQRLFTCKAIIRKHGLLKVRLFLEDGCLFNICVPLRVGKWIHHSRKTNVISDMNLKVDPVYDSEIQLDVNIESNTIKPFHNTKLLSGKSQYYNVNDTDTDLFYDKVLVDAECTHDGSIAHIMKYDKEGGDALFDDLVLDESRLKNLKTLQVNNQILNLFV